MESKHNRVIHLLIIFISLILYSGLLFTFGASMQTYKTPYINHGWMKIVNGTNQDLPDRISEDQIVVSTHSVTITAEEGGEFIWASYAPTDSMIPLLDSGSNGIYYKVNENTTIQIGDVASYDYGGENNIVHRVIDISSDENGTFYIFKGDNVFFTDSQKVRREQIKRVLVGVIY